MQSEAEGLRAYSHEGEIFDQRDRQQIRFFFFFFRISYCQESVKNYQESCTKITFGIRNLNKYFAKIVPESVLKKHLITIKKYINLALL